MQWFTSIFLQKSYLKGLCENIFCWFLQKNVFWNICITCVIRIRKCSYILYECKRPPILRFLELYMLAIHFYQNWTSCLIPIYPVLYCSFREKFTLFTSYKHIYLTLSTNFTSQIVMINSNIVVKCSWNCTLSYCLFIYIFIYIYIVRV